MNSSPILHNIGIGWLVDWFMVFNATFNNISVITAKFYQQLTPLKQDCNSPPPPGNQRQQIN